MEDYVIGQGARIDAKYILESARTFYNSTKAEGKRPAYSDYERYKAMLHDNGWFGDEFLLAKILHL